MKKIGEFIPGFKKIAKRFADGIDPDIMDVDQRNVLNGQIQGLRSIIMVLDAGDSPKDARNFLSGMKNAITMYDRHYQKYFKED